jgi:hypothetical protein
MEKPQSEYSTVQYSTVQYSTHITKSPTHYKTYTYILYFKPHIPSIFVNSSTDDNYKDNDDDDNYKDDDDEDDDDNDNYFIRNLLFQL